MSAIITVQSVDKSFGTRRVLDGVSFAVHAQDRIGLVGVNGSGKSTLMRLVVGAAAWGQAAADDDDEREQAEPDAGLITRRRDLSLEYVPQEPRLDPERSVIDTLREGLRALEAARTRLAALEEELTQDGKLSGDKLDTALAAQAALHERIADLGGWEQDHEIRGLAAALSLPPLAALVGALSIGERRRVAIARALLARPDLLALDEPTNHLDARTIEWLEGRLASLPGALLLVTHDRYFLDRVATRIVEIDRGKIYSYDGNYGRYLEKQAERLDNESTRERARAMFVRRELSWIRRGPKARTTKQQARIDRFDEAVAAKPTRDEQRQGTVTLRLPTGGRLGKTILEARDLGKSLGGKRLFSHLSLILKPGDRVGIVGENGAGKTTLVRTLLGQLAPDEGEVIVGLNTRFAFLDQARADLRDDKTVLEEVAGDSDQVFLEDGPIHVRTFLRMFLFDDGFADTPVGVLSGGERNRVQLAKLLRVGGNLIVLDEPTNDLDLPTLGVLEDALTEFPGCALIVSHDRWFLDRVATGILAFEGDGRVVFYEGNHGDYLARRKPPVPAAPSPAQVTVAVKPGTITDVAAPAIKARRIGFNEKRELDGMEQRIVELEANVERLQAELNDPAIYKSRGADVPAMVAALDAARAEVERSYARWQELEALAR